MGTVLITILGTAVLVGCLLAITCALVSDTETFKALDEKIAKKIRREGE